MKLLYGFFAGVLVASVFLRVWQPPVGRYQVSFDSTINMFTKADTATGRVWVYGTDKKWAEIAVSP